MIAGTAKGHSLKTPKGGQTRPTTDMVKGALFNIIAEHLGGARVLDLFAGTGSLGIEALSRGAEFCTFVDSSRECIDLIRWNLKHTKLMDRSQVQLGDSLIWLGRVAGRQYDIVLLDPPYGRNLVVEALQRLSDGGFLSETGIIIAERDAKDNIPERMGDLKLFRNQSYGGSVLSFYRRME